ncbi:hypothetical protein C499_14350 [Halogeometricum borinquense DSM 11551]|uniref:Uncharacterized protein n=1 Tax=Halogeometricum borinquense (strain ATCC 700274 / DSM 11551 / JCM 10706 / KCTC 4070 / PR3) TaxID=469382 RepID=L9ULW8_HALBP|nr:hypothetical protein C499_14350 [Halogeometricum borinquense DSM 11551]
MSRKIHTDAEVHGDTVSMNLQVLFRDTSGHIDGPIVAISRYSLFPKPSNWID